jgi:hypothetical protein
MLSDFLNNRLHATLFIIDGRITAHGNTNVPNRELHIRLEKKNGKFIEGYISTGALRKYCGDNKIEYTWMQNELQQMNVVKEKSVFKRLGTGTEFAGAPATCLSLNFESPHLDASLIQEPPK